MVAWPAHPTQVVQVWRGEGDLRAFSGHTDRVAALAWSPEGQILATGSRDRSVRLWNPIDENARLLNPFSGEISVLAWSPDGAFLAIKQIDEESVPPTAASQKELHKLLFAAVLGKAALDGIEMSSVPPRGAVLIWERAAGRLTNLPGTSNALGDLAWSPDGRILASGGEGGTLRLWQRAGWLARSLSGPGGTIDQLAWSPVEPYILAAGTDSGAIAIWDTRRESFYVLRAGTCSRSITASRTSGLSCTATRTTNRSCATMPMSP